MTDASTSNAPFRATIVVCDRAFRALEETVPGPIRKSVNGDFVLRYEEKTPRVVVIQKLSRISTGLKASRALLDLGLYHEVGAAFRMLDEFGEDVQFMCFAMHNLCTPETQKAFVDEFFQEEFDSADVLQSTKRHRVPRKKIRAEIARVHSEALNPSDAQAIARTVQNVQSGYVHGPSVHILDMCGGDPPRYYLNGMRGTRRQDTFENTAREYFDRALGAFALAACAFGLTMLAADLRQFQECEYGKAPTENGYLNRAVRRLRGQAKSRGERRE